MSGKKSLTFGGYSVRNTIFADIPNLATTEFNCRKASMNRTVYHVNPPSLKSVIDYDTYSTRDRSKIILSRNKCIGSVLLVFMIALIVTAILTVIFYDDIFDDDDDDDNKFAINSHNISIIQNLTNKEWSKHGVIHHKGSNKMKISRNQTITFENFVHRNFGSKVFNSKWLSSDELLVYDPYKNLRIMKISNKTSDSLLIPNTTVISHRLFGCLELSPDRKYLLCASVVSKVYRYSSLSKYTIFNIKNGLALMLMSPENADDLSIQFAEWGETGSQIVFVYHNNIYYKKDVESPPFQITGTGVESVVFNGIADWVYEEEILEDCKTFLMSPDGTKLVFATIDDSNVELMSWLLYGPYNDKEGTVNQYGKTMSVRYPKPGRENPSVSLRLIELSSLKESYADLELSFGDDLTNLLSPPEDIVKQGNHYFTAMKWIDSNQVAINWMTRAQNYSVLTVYSALNMWKPTFNFRLQSSNGWIDFFKPPMVTPDKTSYLIPILKMINNDTEDYYTHIARVSIKGSKIEFLTTGLMEVKQLLEINEKTNKLYFIATSPDKPGERHLMSVSINESEADPNPYCHTCAISERTDSRHRCLVSEAEFSDDGQYYVLHCKGPSIPHSAIYSTENDSLIAVGESNKKLLKALSKLSLPYRIMIKVPIADGFVTDVMMIVPPDFTETPEQKYALVIHVYGGPGSDHGGVTQAYVLNQFSAFMAANRSVIYAQIDVRGNNNHGSNFMYAVYRKMGTVEVNDAITIARYFRDNTTYVDGERIALWGWSYGGYVTTMAIAGDRSDPVFKCGVAVAPVADWLFYDSVYVERYMGFPTPDDNLENYRKASSLNRLANISGKQYLIMFGTADDNVHSQNAMMIVKGLNEANVNFETQIFPDDSHDMQQSINYLYRRMLLFFDKCFD